ncbi:cytosolic 5'-nucleotidase 3-like [Branchiostoma floridae]|uniref:5'-nucleotidase n=2 Tax=Branchiostoma floridae TaxID=7739 RepID=A0A9J7MLF2_BRAFL|nr:cytosolic 5'-nucleotidase 3-like [Branchiostoma floridae]
MSSSSMLHLLRLVEQDHIHITDANHVEQVLSNLVAAGKQKLRVISDFDQTLSRYAVDGVRCPMSHDVIAQSSLMSEQTRVKVKKVVDYYYPKEISLTIPMSEKVQLMVDYWTQIHDIFLASDLNQQDISSTIHSNSPPLREGYDAFMSALHQHDIPLLVFSAGLGDVIQEMFAKYSVVYPNCRVVSNFMKFDDAGKLVGFHDPLIHIFNKNKSVLPDESYFTEQRKRTNVILLGDSPGDLQMADGVPNVENVLKIGYLNAHLERLDLFTELYDIVLVEDETMDVVNSILQKIIDPSC